MCGASVGFSSGDVKLLTDDLQALHPTIFPTVPRLLNRMYDKVCLLKHCFLAIFAIIFHFDN